MLSALKYAVVIAALTWAHCARAQQGDEDCATNWKQQRAVAAKLIRIRRQMDVIWPRGTPCKGACIALQKEASALLDEQLRLEVIAEVLHCPLDGDT